MLPPTAALVAAFGAVGASCTGIRQYGFLTHFEVNTSEARRRVRQMYNDFGILDFQFYDAFYNYSRPMLGDSWVSKPSVCFTGMPRLVRKETVKAYTDEIRKLPGGHARSWLYVQAVAADEPMEQMSKEFSPWLYKSGDQVAWTFDKKCLYVYRLTQAWADRMVDMWAPAAAEMGFAGIHWDQVGRVTDDPQEVAEMVSNVATFLRHTRKRLAEWDLRQTFNFVDGFGWHPSLYEHGSNSSTVEFPYWECWNDQTEWIFWSLFNFTAEPSGHAVFARYPDPNCCGNPSGSDPEATLLQRWERAGSACNAYLVLGDGSRRLNREYFPSNAEFNRNGHSTLARSRHRSSAQCRRLMTPRHTPTIPAPLEQQQQQQQQQLGVQLGPRRWQLIALIVFGQLALLSGAAMATWRLCPRDNHRFSSDTSEEDDDEDEWVSKQQALVAPQEERQRIAWNASNPRACTHKVPAYPSRITWDSSHRRGTPVPLVRTPEQQLTRVVATEARAMSCEAPAANASHELAWSVSVRDRPFSSAL